MKPREFLSRVLGDGIHYIGWPSNQLLPSGKPKYNHKPFSDVIDGFSTAQGLAQKKDVYFTHSSFKTAKVWDEKGGYNKSYRKEENVLGSKSLFVDFDFKAYASQKQAMEAFQTFVKTSIIPKPNLVVYTGGGLHIYWVLDQFVSKSNWVTTASGLEEYCLKEQFNVDVGVSTDSTRLLRVPGTKNFKYDSLPEVKILFKHDEDISYEEMSAKLDGYAKTSKAPTPDIKADDNVVQLFSNGNEDLIDNYDAQNTYTMERILDHCPAMADTMARRGEGDSYGLWKNVLHLAAFCEDGREYIHPMSDGYDGYNPAEVEDKFNESIKVKHEGHRGPTTCELFSKHSEKCLKCKYFGHIKSPIVLGKKEEKNQEAHPTYTLPGRTCVNKKDPSSEEVQRLDVANCEIENWQIGYDKELGQIMSFSFKVKNRWKYMVFPLSHVADAKKLHSELLKQGVSIQSKQMRPFTEAVVSWMERLQQVQNYEDEQPFGWTEDGEGFAIAGDVYRPDGVRDAGLCDPAIAANYKPAGTLAGWQKAMAPLLEDERKEAHTMLSASFASPLINMTEINAFTVAFRSLDSGVGKSTFLKAAQSVWGEPVKTMGGLNDTAHSTSKKMAYSRFMPLCYDELRGTREMEDFAKLVFRAAQGKERQRMNSNSMLKSAEDINSVIIAASNHSVAEAMIEHTGDSNAGVLRMFEVEMPKHKSDKTKSLGIARASGELRHNYGVAGRVYTEYIVKHLSEVKSTYSKVLERLIQYTNASSDERFWTQAGAAMITGAMVARSAKICDIDPAKVQKGVVDMITTGRNMCKEVVNQSQGHVTRVVDFARGYLLITDEDGAKKNATVASPPPLRVAKLQLVTRTGQLYISKEVLRSYSKEKKLVMAHVEDSLENTHGVEKVSYAIGQGTQDYPNPRTTCYKVDVATVLGAHMLKRWHP